MALLGTSRMCVTAKRFLSEAAAEAEVVVSDGEFVCVAFCQPCVVAVGDVLTEPLHVFELYDARLSDSSDFGIWPTISKGLGRRVVARVVSVAERLLTVGGIEMIVDEDLPGGIEDGDIIEFECARIDLW